MQTTIGEFDSSTRTVRVTFVEDGVVHQRDVNAALTDAGGYDKEVTEARVADVARGVEQKIALGVIVNAPAEDTAEV